MTRVSKLLVAGAVGAIDNGNLKGCSATRSDLT